MDPFELRLKNAMRKGDQTHTKQPLNSSSMSDVLEAARTASRWENGVPNVRGATRSDLGRDGTRPSCTLVPREVIDPAADLSNRKGAA
jgi:CO/xanthine dehydrogenase Mo-binding subunit